MNDLYSILCITDPATHPPFDTTVELYGRLVSDPRFVLYHALPDHVMAMAEGEVACELVVTGGPWSYERFRALRGAGLSKDLSEFHCVFCRTDKPFPEGYLEVCASVEQRVPFVNKPSGYLETSCKLFLQEFSDLLPASLWTSSLDEAIAFARKQGAVVLKANRSYGGRGVFRLLPEAEGICVDGLASTRRFADWPEAFGALMQKPEDLPVQLMEYLREAPRYGDKRVLVVDEEVYGGYLRHSAGDHWIHNISAGGSAAPSNVTEEELEIIKKTSPFYTARGMRTLGYDFLMGNEGKWVLSEINAGNIGGYGRLETLSGQPVYARLLDALLTRIFHETSRTRG